MASMVLHLHKHFQVASYLSSHKGLRTSLLTEWKEHLIFQLLENWGGKCHEVDVYKLLSVDHWKAKSPPKNFNAPLTFEHCYLRCQNWLAEWFMFVPTKSLVFFWNSSIIAIIQIWQVESTSWERLGDHFITAETDRVRKKFTGFI